MEGCGQVEDEDSNEEHEGLELEEEDLGNTNQPGHNHDREEGRCEDNRGGEEDEDEDEDDISPQPPGKRRRAARTTAPQKRPRLASPIHSNTIRTAEGEALDNYLVGTTTESLSEPPQAGLGYPAADQLETLSPDDR